MNRDGGSFIILLVTAAVLCTAGAYVVLYPSADEFSVTADGDTGISFVSGTGEYVSGSQVTLVAHLKSYYVFDGWFADDGDMVSSEPELSFEVTGDTWLECRSHTDHVVSVVLEGDDGVVSCTGGGEHILDSEVDLSVSVRDGYRFLGWYGPDGLLSSEPEFTMPAADVTLHVRTALAGKVSLTIVPDEGIASVSGDGMYAEGSETVLSAVLKPGYSFKGWYFDSWHMFSDRQTEEVRVNSDTVLYAVTSPEYTVDIIPMQSVKVSGEGTFRHDRSAELTAEESVKGIFKGWYSLDGTCLSTDPVYVPPRGDSAVVAVTSSAAFSGESMLNIDVFPSWYSEGSYCLVTEHYSGVLVNAFKGSAPHSFGLSDGLFDVTFYNGKYDGSARSEVHQVRAGTASEQTFEWTSAGEVHRIEVSLDPSVYDGIKRQWWISRSPIITETGVRAFKDSESQPIRAMADALAAEAAGMTQLQTAQLVLDMVQQCFCYETDDVYSGGFAEYWKYPVETLFDRRGDCEDTSLLYASLMDAMGIDSAVILFDGHMSAGVNVPGASGKHYEYPGTGVSYYYCETTGAGWALGSSPPKYDECNLLVPI